MIITQKTFSALAIAMRCASTIAVSFVLLAGTQTAMAGNTVRDHRGPNGASQGGVTVDGKRGKVTAAPKLLGYRGFKGLTGTDYGKGGLEPEPPYATIAD